MEISINPNLWFCIGLFLILFCFYRFSNEFSKIISIIRPFAIVCLSSVNRFITNIPQKLVGLIFAIGFVLCVSNVSIHQQLPSVVAQVEGTSSVVAQVEGTSSVVAQVEDTSSVVDESKRILPFPSQIASRVPRVAQMEDNPALDTFLNNETQTNFDINTIDEESLIQKSSYFQIARKSFSFRNAFSNKGDLVGGMVIQKVEISKVLNEFGKVIKLNTNESFRIELTLGTSVRLKPNFDNVMSFEIQNVYWTIDFIHER